MEQSYRPSKDVKNAIIVWSGTTTSAGLGGGTTLVDTALTQGNTYWDYMGVLILSGNSNGQMRTISSFVTGTITVSPAFASQIASGTKYNIIAAVQPAAGGGSATLANQNLILGDIGDASASTLFSLYGILGNPSASLATTILDGIDARANNPTLNALLGVTDAAGRSVNGNIGDFQAQTNLQTLLAALGIPDTLNKPLYTCLITDRLDNGTYGLSALNTDLDTIITDTEKIYDVSLGISPTDGSLASFIATGGTALGTRLPVNKSLYDVLGAATTSTLGSLYAILGNPAAGQDLSTRIGYEGATSLAAKLTAARAGYIDELAAANIPADIDIIKADTPYIHDQAINSPTTGSIAQVLANNIYTRTNNKTLNAVLGIPDQVSDTAMRFMLDTIFHDNFDDESLSTTLWGAAVVTGSTTVTESSSAPDTLRIYNAGAGTLGTGYLPTIAQFSNNLSIRSKIEVFLGALAATGERCQAYLLLYTSANDYIYFGNYRDTSEAINSRGYIVYNIAAGGATAVIADAAILDNIAREYRIDVTAENILFYIDDILVYTLKDTTLTNYYVQLYGGTQSNTDIIDIRYDYCKVNRLSDDYRQIYKKLLQIQGGTDSIGAVINRLDSALDLNAITSSLTATGGVDTIYSNTNASAFLFRNVDISLVNMIAGDVVTIIKSKMVDGTNYAQVSSTTYSGAQTNTCITITGNEGCRSGVKVTLTQSAGTLRAFPYTYYDEVSL